MLRKLFAAAWAVLALALAAPAAADQHLVIGWGNGGNWNPNGVYYMPPGGPMGAFTTDATVGCVIWRTTGTFTNFYVALNTNSHGAISKFILYVNGADSILEHDFPNSASVTPTTNGGSNLDTDTVSVTAGQTVCLKVDGTGGAVNLNAKPVTVDFYTSGTNPAASHISSFGTTTSNTANFMPPAGVTTTSGEAGLLVKGLEAATISNLTGFGVSSGSSTVTFTARVNGADSLSRPSGIASASAAANFRVEDTLQSDTIDSAKTFSVKRSLTTGSPNLNGAGFKYASNTAGSTMLIASGAALSAGATYYIAPFDSIARATSEAGMRFRVPFNAEISMLTGYASANASTADVVFTLRDFDGASTTTDTACTFTVPTSGFAVGAYQDATHTCSITAGHSITIKATGMTTGVTTLASLNFLIRDVNATGVSTSAANCLLLETC